MITGQKSYETALSSIPGPQWNTLKTTVTLLPSSLGLLMSTNNNFLLALLLCKTWPFQVDSILAFWKEKTVLRYSSVKWKSAFRCWARVFAWQMVDVCLKPTPPRSPRPCRGCRAPPRLPPRSSSTCPLRWYSFKCEVQRSVWYFKTFDWNASWCSIECSFLQNHR